MTLRLPCASVSKRVLVNNLSYENKFALYENEHARETFSYEWFHTKTRFDTEARQFEMIYYQATVSQLFIIYRNIFSIHSRYENQDINHCVTRLFVRFRCLTGNLSRLQFAITACSPRTLIPISRKASYRVPRSTLAL